MFRHYSNTVPRHYTKDMLTANCLTHESVRVLAADDGAVGKTGGGL